jgi:hypothetical protein
MAKEERINELLELRGLLLLDLKSTNRIEAKIGPNEHLDKMRDLYLDQLSDIDRELNVLRTIINL